MSNQTRTDVLLHYLVLHDKIKKQITKMIGMTQEDTLLYHKIMSVFAAYSVITTELLDKTPGPQILPIDFNMKITYQYYDQLYDANVLQDLFYISSDILPGDTFNDILANTIKIWKSVMDDIKKRKDLSHVKINSSNKVSCICSADDTNSIRYSYDDDYFFCEACGYIISNSDYGVLGYLEAVSNEQKKNAVERTEQRRSGRSESTFIYEGVEYRVHIKPEYYRHFINWTSKLILGQCDLNTFDADTQARYAGMKAEIHAKKPVVFKSVYVLRTMMKSYGLSKMNDVSSFIIKDIYDIKLPTFSFEDIDKMNSVFVFVLDVCDEVTQGESRKYYPYFIYKIIEYLWYTKTLDQEKLKMLKYIYLQQTKTLLAADANWKLICEATKIKYPQLADIRYISTQPL